MEWQSYVGPVLVLRPQDQDGAVKHFNSLDAEIVWDFIRHTLSTKDWFDVKPHRDFTPNKIRDFTFDYLRNQALNQKYDENRTVHQW